MPCKQAANTFFLSGSHVKSNHRNASCCHTDHDGNHDLEAVEALVALGYSSTDAMRAVRKVTDVAPDDVEGLLKAALKQL